MTNSKSKKLLMTIATLLIIMTVISFIIDVHGRITIIDGNFHVTVNDEVVEFNDVYGHPKLIKETERTLVPLRIISEKMGYQVDWDQENKTAIIKGGGNVVKITIGENTALVNGERVYIDKDKDGKPLQTKAMLLKVKGDENPRTYVPLRFISETTDAKIGYKNVEGVHHISITTKKDDKPNDGKISFNPKEDVLEDGRITEEKSIEYLEEFLRNIKVTKENGKYYLNYNQVDLPDYGKVQVGISFGTNTGLNFSNGAYVEELLLPTNQSFKKELSAEKMKGIKRVSIGFSIINQENTNKHNRTTARLGYLYYKPDGTSEYKIFNEYNTTIQKTNYDKSNIFGNLL